jgi:hypothetical protein
MISSRPVGFMRDSWSVNSRTEPQSSSAGTELRSVSVGQDESEDPPDHRDHNRAPEGGPEKPC